MLNLSSSSSWISECQRKKKFFLGTIQRLLMFSLGSIKYLVSEMNYFFICPAAVAILDFRWTKTKLFKRVKYDTSLQNNIFIPRVISEKMLKFQHQKELVVAAMLNFWIKWKTCNVENHPCNTSTMFGSNWACG